MKNLWFKRMLLLVFILIFTLMLTSCKGNMGDTSEVGGKDGAKSAKDHLVVGLPADSANFDPNDISVQMVHAMKKQLYETLVTKDNDGNILPLLAESWEYKDDCTIVFNIRKGVKFHNGDELKASDVLFSLQRASTVPSAKPALANIDFDESKVIDDYTVAVVTKDIYVPQLSYLEWPLTAIFSEKSYKESNGDFNKAPIGTGPFKFVSYLSGDKYEFEAFEDYWDTGKPYIKRLTMRVITEAANRTIELETGGVDIIYEVAAIDIPRLEENKDIKVYRDLSLNTNYMALRTDHKPFDDIRVRKAVAYALDIDTAVKSAYNGTGLPAIGYCSPNVVDFAADVLPYEYNPEKAKELLVEAGFPNGFETEFHTDTTRERLDISEIFQNQLGKVGIKCKVISMDIVAYQDHLDGDDFNICLDGLTTTTGEGDKAFRWFHSEHPVNKELGNKLDYEFDRIIDEAAKTMDNEKRKELYKKAQQMLKDDCFVIPIVHREILSAARSNVKGFENNVSYEAPVLKNIYFE